VGIRSVCHTLLCYMSSPHSPQQTTISRFFASSPTKSSSPKKRASSPIDLTSDNDLPAAPPLKRPRLDTVIDIESETDSHSAGTSSKAEKKKIKAKGDKKDKQQDLKQRLRRENSLFLDTNNDSTSVKKSPPRARASVTAAEVGSNSAGDMDDVSATFELLATQSRRSKGKQKASVGVTSPATAKGSGALGKPAPRIGPSGETYTPLELQVLELKEANPGIVLMFHVGYKYKFYGEDAHVAAKELGIVCYTKRNFDQASVPIHRRDLYLKKFLSKGLKVGIVAQTETAALKKEGEGSSRLFKRAVTELYTIHTFLDELDSVDQVDPYTSPTVIFVGERAKARPTGDEQVNIAIITISASTGEVLWDEFDDSHMRIELESRFAHANPSQIILPYEKLTNATERLVKRLSKESISVERSKENSLIYTEAYDFLTGFYRGAALRSSSTDLAETRLATITGFPRSIVVLLAHAIKYLSPFNLSELFLQTEFFAKYSSHAHMLLSASTLSNLEIYRNDTDYTSRGSLLSVIDRTKTRFGARLLRNWIGRPLVDTTGLKARTEAVEEILHSTSSDLLIGLRNALRGLPDLARGLSRIQFGKITVKEFARLLKSFRDLGELFDPMENLSSPGLRSIVLNEIVYAVSCLRKPMTKILSEISLPQAQKGLKHELWVNPEKYPLLDDLAATLQVVEHELQEELKTIRKQLKMPSLKWTQVKDEEYVVEIDRHLEHLIPDNWINHSRTQYKVRYYTPTVKEKIHEKACQVEARDAESERAFQDFLQCITDRYYEPLRKAVNQLGVADCLFSLSEIARQEDYVRPEFTQEDVLHIRGGRHPMIECIRSDPYHPNDVYVGDSKPRALVCTGPNMGGKSCVVKMVALLCIMSQIGCYVPASKMKLRTLDGIFTRMGASDNLAKGKSTFMVEMTDTSDILRSATDRSLVILDELGRGTSTYDGMAIASAVLQHLIQATKCKTLFITHYPLVASELERAFPTCLQNSHMSYMETVGWDGSKQITFLYKLVPGITTNSFGVECARLAGVTKKVLDTAAQVSDRVKAQANSMARRNQTRKCLEALRGCLGLGNSLDQPRTSSHIAQLRLHAQGFLEQP
jgi:DNA mismatch repair protein MSH3